jgi:hypothetical protein
MYPTKIVVHNSEGVLATASLNPSKSPLLYERMDKIGREQALVINTDDQTFSIFTALSIYLPIVISIQIKQ